MKTTKDLKRIAQKKSNNDYIESLLNSYCVCGADLFFKLHTKTILLDEIKTKLSILNSEQYNFINHNYGVNQNQLIKKFNYALKMFS